MKLKDDQSDKMPFNQGQMTTIYTSPMFTGCKSETQRAKEGHYVYKNPYYWTFLIWPLPEPGSGEIVQLEFEDIKQSDGVWFFDINDEGDKTVKTAKSRRKAPVHDFLIKIGFLEYYQERLQRPENR